MVETAYLPAQDDHAWAERAAQALGELFDGVIGVGSTGARFDLSTPTLEPMLVTGLGKPFDQGFLDAFGVDDFVRFMQIDSLLDTHSAIIPRLSPHGQEIMRAEHARHGSKDAIGLVLQPEPGVSLAVFCVLDRRVHFEARHRTRLQQLGLHLEAALRLRRQPEILQAVVSSTGRVEFKDDLVQPRLRAISEAVRQADSARHEQRDNPDALAFWQALIGGDFTIVPRTEAGYGVLENAPHTRALRALTNAEARVVQHAARGLSNKLLAYALGMSPSNVSRLLTSASLKLGMGRRASLVHMAATLLHGEAAAEPLVLTQAEHDVLTLVRAGLSNREIGKARGRSERTVANQIAALLRKTGSPNRRRLIAGRFHSTK